MEIQGRKGGGAGRAVKLRVSGGEDLGVVGPIRYSQNLINHSV